MDDEYRMKKQEKAAKLEMDKLMREKWYSGEITEEEYCRYMYCEEDSYADIDEIL